MSSYSCFLILATYFYFICNLRLRSTTALVHPQWNLLLGCPRKVCWVLSSLTGVPQESMLGPLLSYWGAPGKWAGSSPLLLACPRKVCWVLSSLTWVPQESVLSPLLSYWGASGKCARSSPLLPGCPREVCLVLASLTRVPQGSVLGAWDLVSLTGMP